MDMRKHYTLFFLTLCWLGAGLFLVVKGTALLSAAAKGGYAPLLEGLAPIASQKEVAAALLIALGLGVGFFKAKKVLKPLATKNSTALQTGETTPKAVLIRTAILVGLMMGLGMGIRYLGVPGDLRGTILIAVGFALLQGGAVYMRFAATLDHS